MAQCNLLIKQMKEKIMDESQDVRGFNIGVNNPKNPPSPNPR